MIDGISNIQLKNLFDLLTFIRMGQIKFSVDPLAKVEYCFGEVEEKIKNLISNMICELNLSMDFAVVHFV